MTEENPGEVSEAAAQTATVDSNPEQMSAPAEEHVPLSALQAERKQRQELQQNLRMMQDHMELLKANQQQRKVDQTPTLNDDDVLTYGEAKKYLDSIQQGYKQSVEELRMQQAHPDYADIVKNYLPDVLQQNPELREDLQAARNPYKLAYLLAKKSDRYLAEQQQLKKSDKATRILENSQKPGSLSSIGSTAPVTSHKNWKSMSDAEFKQHVTRNLGYS